MRGLASLIHWMLDANLLDEAPFIWWEALVETFEGNDGLWYASIHVGRGYILTEGHPTRRAATQAVVPELDAFVSR
jgi:hypothetical protein